MKFTESQLEAAIIEHLGEEGYPHILGETICTKSNKGMMKLISDGFLPKLISGELRIPKAETQIQ